MLVAAIGKADTLANHVGSKGAGEPPIIPTAAAIGKRYLQRHRGKGLFAARDAPSNARSVGERQY